MVVRLMRRTSSEAVPEIALPLEFPHAPFGQVAVIVENPAAT